MNFHSLDIFVFLSALFIDKIQFNFLTDKFNQINFFVLFGFSIGKQDDERRDSIPEEPENQQNNHINHAKVVNQPFEEKRCRATYERSHSLAEPLENRQTNHFNENT